MPGILIAATVPIELYQRLEAEAKAQGVSFRNLVRLKLGGEPVALGRPRLDAPTKAQPLLAEYRDLLDRVAYLKHANMNAAKPEAKLKKLRSRLEFAGLIDPKGKVIDFGAQASGYTTRTPDVSALAPGALKLLARKTTKGRKS